MSTSRLLRTTLLVALASSAAYMPACSSSSDGAPSSNALTAGVIFQGDAAEGTLLQVLNTKSDNWGWAGGSFITPKPNSSVAETTNATISSAAKPYTFSWRSDPSDSFPQAGAAGALSIAAAGGFTGLTYLLVFSTPDNQRLLRVYTTIPSYTPSASAWKQLVAVGGPITVALTTASFENDQLTVEGGPHSGQQLSLTIGGS
ncbi:MAG: hypothetical protein ABI548_06500 [Polyangiaceae bacterium]